MRFDGGMPESYRRPGWFTQNVLNPTVRGLAKLGVSLQGSRVLEVRGRKSGQVRETAVNLLTHHGATYLYAPRGVTEWVLNLRAADGECATRIGRKHELWVASEVTDVAKYTGLVRAYLKAWEWEVGAFMPSGISADSSDEDLAGLIDLRPGFLLTRR